MYRNLFLILFALVLTTNAYDEQSEDTFVDIAVRLKGNNRDFLVADLIAEERDVLNAGHVGFHDRRSWYRMKVVIFAGSRH